MLLGIPRLLLRPAFVRFAVGTWEAHLFVGWEPKNESIVAQFHDFYFQWLVEILVLLPVRVLSP